MKKKAVITTGILLIICAVILVCMLGIKEYKARIPSFSVKTITAAKSGDTLVIGDLVDVEVKGDYQIEYEVRAGSDWGYIDEEGVLHILDNSKDAVGTIVLDVTATGSVNKSTTTSVNIIIENGINENNSYEVTFSDIHMRMYNGLKDMGNGVFSSTGGYNISIHTVDSANNLDELEEEVKKYAYEEYSMTNAPEDDYTVEDVILSSGKKARIITFHCIEDGGEYKAFGTTGGTAVRVVIYAFCEENYRMFIVDNNPVDPIYEMEQIANTVK